MSNDTTYVVHYTPGVFWTELPRDANDARQALKDAGWHFHWGPGQRCQCPSFCGACKAGNVPPLSWFTVRPSGALSFARYFDPAARAAAEEVKATMEASRAADAAITIPAPIGQEYLPYQKAGIAWIAKRRSVLLADEMGLGKTIQAIGGINLDPEIRNVLVICPATLLENWRRELCKWLTRPHDVRICRPGDQLPPLAPAGHVNVTITNYESLSKRAKAGSGEPKKFTPSDLHRLLMGSSWDLCVVDEAQRLRSEDSNQTLAICGRQERKGRNPRPAIRGVAQLARHKIAITGTPLANRPRDAFQLLHLLAPRTFWSYWRYTERFCDAQVNKFGRDDSGASHLDEWQNLLRAGTEHEGLMIRRLKQDVLAELPPKRRTLHVLPVESGAHGAIEAEREAYRPFAERCDALRAAVEVASLRGDTDELVRAVAALTEAEKVSFQAMSRARLELGLAKVRPAVEYLRDLLEGGVDKVVVFGIHQEVIDAIEASLAEYGVVQLTGRTPVDRRQDLCDRFQTDPSCRVFVGNVQAAGVGLTLTASSTVVLVEASWVPGDNQQAEDRCHRIGTTSSVSCIYLVFDGTLDQRVMEVLIEKMRVQHEALDMVHATAEVLLGAPPERREHAPAQFTAEIRDAAREAIDFLAGRCDGARKRDGVGFGGQWVGAGHWLAGLASWNDRHTGIALRICRWHQRQLDPQLRARLGLVPDEPPTPPKRKRSRRSASASEAT